MAQRLADGSIQMHDGRIIYANSILQAQDIIEILPLFMPAPVWPFVSGGGGGGGNGTPGARGADGAPGANGANGAQGPQGPGIGNPGPQGNQGNQGNAGTNGTNGAQGNQGNTGATGPQGVSGPQGNQGIAGTNGNQGNQGNIGPQGNQGSAGPQGAAGAQGNQGIAGTNGNQGNQGNQGLIGPQGDAGLNGAQGNQGFQGTAGTGVQGAQGSIGTQGAQGALSNDIFASDRVVDPGGAGTDTTLAAALAALPANGGTIYVKAGTYAISATMTLPLKDVTIIGGGGNLGGPGNDPSATVFDLGANAIFLFNAPGGGGGTTFGSYKFQGFKVVGTSLPGQGFFEAPVAASDCTILCENVHIEAVQDIVKTAGQDVTATFRDCTLNPTTTTASFWHGSGPGGELIWDHVQAHLSFGGSANAITGGPSWDVAYSYIGGPPGFSAYNVKDINWVAFFLGNLNDKAEVTVTAAISTIVSCQFIGVSLILNTTLVFVSNSWFSGSKDGVSPQVTCNGVGGEGDYNFSGVNFDASGAAATHGLNISASTNVAVTGCQFEGHGTAGIAASGVTTLSVTGCRFSETIPVLESASTVVGRYTGNVGFDNSTIIGPDSVVEEFRRKDVTGGATVDALTAVFTHTNAKGLAGAGAIKNTGANSLTIRRTGTDAFGVTDFQEDVVLSGAAFTWPMDSALGTALPSFTVFTVSVKSTTPGSPTTYDLHHASTGAY